MSEDFFDAHVEYHDDEVWPGGGAHNGRSAMIARFREVIETLGIKESVVERVIDTGDSVAQVTRATGRSPSAAVPRDHRWGYVGRIADGRLVCFRAYHNADDALKVVGEEQAMSHGNVEVVHQFYDAFERRDREDVAALLHTQIE